MRYDTASARTLPARTSAVLRATPEGLPGTSEVFRRKIAWCLSEITERIAACLEQECRPGGALEDSGPREVARLLADCWEGAALRTRLQRDPPTPRRDELD